MTFLSRCMNRPRSTAPWSAMMRTKLSLCPSRSAAKSGRSGARSTDLVIFVGLWYIVSLLALWANKFLVTTVEVNTSVLSFMQVAMSVVCGVLVEVRGVGTEKFANDLYRAFAWPSSSKQDDQALPRSRLKDMATLGCVRIINIVLDLVALKYISVSLAQTIKSSAPFFTVALTYAVLGKPTTWAVSLTLVPIMLGLACCSFSAVGVVSSIGILAALSANCTDCFQNVVSKKLLTSNSYSITQLQLYSSIVAATLQAALHVAFRAATDPSAASPSSSLGDGRRVFVLSCLVVNGVAYYVQSALAYRVMSLLSPVSHSVVSTLKRALLIMVSIYRYGESVTAANYVGISLVLGGVYLFNHASNQGTTHDFQADNSATTSDGRAVVKQSTTNRHLNVIAIV
ncbi:hypothetical protein H310_11916 [Aphanomyces invadans]|uniref:Sugar phosphate transporter domain-containing protein n=1 Tax=Aphanomyces invadans TaxID=157072 RepID=A0A024TJL4_9STRA|nr:hypothetical protein H310_11916 [Aphanomyces invadans]ETV94238.1 hypothetical protein H310_11916 [Aphanomyces invadans]|eukprot:XP_008877000.1 hypothetical protein H310_11916 [Aphanomyces invadans]